MKLVELTIRNFRNVARLDCEMPPEGAVIIGGNGQGKTNLLEAIYSLVLFRSLRGAKDRELVRFGEAGFFVGGWADGWTAGWPGVSTDSIEGPNRRVTVGYDATTRRKKVTIDGTEVPKLSEAVGQILAVQFSPADGGIVSGGPGARRRYLDVLLSVSQRGYLGRLSAMRLALKQRNAALRRGRPDEAQAFDQPFAAAGTAVATARRCWVERWSDRFVELTAELGEPEAAAMRYQGHGPGGDGSEGWVELLAGALERDTRRGITSVGPHRDDLKLMLGGREVRTFGSAGQQRTAAIALRLLEAETLMAARQTAPVALYDDVFAELDGTRQERLLRLIREVLPGQAIVVAPREAEVPAALFDRPRWQITGGVLER